ncbi:hypothetical protein [Hahella sp. HN01]|uniref:nuclear transport factor 2 family protein n=1 Tax=Hahella sp. HN01 TaxID=2847262 RepID=UPI001C1EE484|nr:hypothetical protein [Hahella sp. HN01]MBU6955409.1 hypothetical protein [Hahella sp. HN01]
MLSELSNKEKVFKLLKGIETGDPDAASVVNEKRYVQHNPHTGEGSLGLAELFKQIAKTGPKVTMVRAFEDQDFVFAHMKYEFSSVKAAFEVFRFEDGLAVEHWDNLQPLAGPNPSGHGMLDGPQQSSDLHLTETNRTLVREYVNEVLINRQLQRLEDFVSGTDFIQHNPEMRDGVASLHEALSIRENDRYALTYTTLHRVLAEGDFVLSVSEALWRDTHSSFYDLFRVQAGKIVEHWDTIEPIPPRSQWKNDNGKF